jgi:type 1 fimbria pilin
MQTFLKLMAGIMLCTGIYAQAYGQDDNTSRISIQATANVVKSIEMQTMRNMQLNEVQPSQQTISIDPMSDTETGKMKAIGDANGRIRISFIKQRTLTHPDGSTLTFTYTVAGNDEDDQPSAEVLKSDNRDLTLNADGEYYFWIGGEVNVENAKPGGYNGNFTIEVEYI